MEDNTNKKRGRPLGTKKNGGKSPEMKLRILRTKTWAWTCLHLFNRTTTKDAAFLEKESERALAKAFPPYIKDKDGTKVIVEPDIIDNGRWSLWLNGKKGTPTPGGFKQVFNRATEGGKRKLIKKFARTNLWPETHPAYHIGPWVSVKNDSKVGSGDGAFVPLWSSISGEMNTLREDWFKIPLEIWKKWDPYHVEEKYFFCCTKTATGRRSGFQDLYELACRLSKPNKNIPPLVSLTACLTAARICGDKKIMLFEPNTEVSSWAAGRQSRYIVLAEMRDYLFEDLSKINISFQEIIDVASDHGLTIYDYYTLGELGSEFSGLVDEMNDDLNLTASTMAIDANTLVALNQDMLANYIYNHLCMEREALW